MRRCSVTLFDSVHRQGLTCSPSPVGFYAALCLDDDTVQYFTVRRFSKSC